MVFLRIRGIECMHFLIFLRILGIDICIHILRLDPFFSGRHCYSNFRGDDILRPAEAPGDFRDCCGDSHPANKSRHAERHFCSSRLPVVLCLWSFLWWPKTHMHIMLDQTCCDTILGVICVILGPAAGFIPICIPQIWKADKACSGSFGLSI